MKAKIVSLIFFSGLAAGLVWMFLQAQAVHVGDHSRYQEYLRQIQVVDATLNQNVLKARYGVVDDYDALVKGSLELQRLALALANVPRFMPTQVQQDIRNLLTEFNKLVQIKVDQLERFKTRYAVLKNSSRYLPTLLQELIAGNPFGDKALVDRLSSLFQDVLLYNTRPTEQLSGRIKQHLGELTSYRERQGSKADGGQLDLVITHTRSILEQNEPLKALIEALVDTPIDRLRTSMAQVYERKYQQMATTAAQYRSYLSWGTGLFLVCVFGMILRRPASPTATSRLPAAASV